MSKTFYVPHFNRDTIEYASRERDKSKTRDQNTASFSEKHLGRERFGEFSRSHSGLRCLLFASKAISITIAAIRRRSKVQF